MALMSCPECQREISTRAATCPSCGYPIASDKAQASGDAWRSPSVWSKVVVGLTAWAVFPWIARVVAFVAACVVAYFLFTNPR